VSHRSFLAVSVTLILLPVTVAFADFSGRVVGVTDGDTITVLHDGKGEKIRLNGIDCPEQGRNTDSNPVGDTNLSRSP
jgi:endonuclease YncB( thermonuclease family)